MLGGGDSSVLLCYDVQNFCFVCGYVTGCHRIRLTGYNFTHHKVAEKIFIYFVLFSSSP